MTNITYFIIPLTIKIDLFHNCNIPEAQQLPLVQFQTDGRISVESYLNTGAGFLPNLTQVK